MIENNDNLYLNADFTFTGEGILRYNNQMYKGRWKNGHPVGLCKLCYYDENNNIQYCMDVLFDNNGKAIMPEEAHENAPVNDYDYNNNIENLNNFPNNEIVKDPIELEIQWLNNQQEGVKTDDNSDITAKNFINALHTACKKYKSDLLASARNKITELTECKIDGNGKYVINIKQPKQIRNNKILNKALSWLFFHKLEYYQKLDFEELFLNYENNDNNKKIIDNIIILLHYYYEMTKTAMPAFTTALDEKLKEKLTYKIKKAAPLEEDDKKIIDAFMLFFSNNADFEDIIKWLNKNQNNEELLDIFCKKVRIETLGTYPFTTHDEYEKCTYEINQSLISHKDAAITEFDKLQKEQNGAIGVNNINQNQIMNNMLNNNNIRNINNHNLNLRQNQQMMNNNNQMINNNNPHLMMNMQNQNLMMNNNMINNPNLMANKNNNQNPIMNNNMMNNMQNQNPMMNNISPNLMMNNNNMPNNMGNNNNNNNPMINNNNPNLMMNNMRNNIGNNNRLNMINSDSVNVINLNQQQSIGENNINLYNHYSQSDDNNNNNNNIAENNSNEVLKEDDYNNFISDLLNYNTLSLGYYQGKKIQDPKKFQKKTNVCWLCRLFNCCTTTNEIELDNIVRKKIKNKPTMLSCDDILREFRNFMSA